MAVLTSLIPIKIQCGCGQRYAFDVEPGAGPLAGGVSCPACGADGTGAANAILAERVPARPAAPVSGVVRVAAAAPSAPRVVSVDAAATAPSPAPAPGRGRLPGQLDPERAKIEARSKIMWGDDPAQVASFLMAQGFKAGEAKAVIAPIIAERAETVRKTGINKIFVGIGMMCVPVIAFFIFMSVGYFPVKIFGITLAVGVWGAWRVLSGVLMVLSPKGENGDVADM